MRKAGAGVGAARSVGGAAAVAACLLLAHPGPGPAQEPRPFDLVVAGGRVVDGTGAPAFEADVGVRDGRIAAVGDLSEAPAARRLDAAGLVVAPGFIDPHTHTRRRIREMPTADPFLLQGVTTLVDGNDGSSPLPLGPFLDSVAEARPAPNFAMFVGHGSIRDSVMGTDDRPPTPAELERMEALVAEGMRQGALGLSTGLAYVPGSYASTDEVVALARVAARHGGIYISHMRDEGKGVLASVRETVRIGEEAGVPVQMTHHKVGGPRQWGSSAESLRMIEEARARGVDITFDQYPYTASSTGLGFLVPAWARAGDGLEARLEDPEQRRRIVEDMEAFIDERFADDPDRVQLVGCDFDPSLAGKTLGDVLDAEGRPRTVGALVDLVLEVEEKGRCGAILHSYAEEDVERFLRSEHGMVGSDGSLVPFGEGSPHPRGYGAHARILARYVRERGVLPLETAIWKMSGFPARRLGLDDRGLVREGMAADLVVLDPERVADRATFADPHRYAQGVRHVLVAGIPVVEDGRVTGARPGRVLRGPGR